MYDKHKGEYVILGDYINSSTKIRYRHEVCGYVGESQAQYVLNKKGCTKCEGNLKLTQQEFEEEVKGLVGDEYEVVGEYKSMREKVMLIHNVCGKEYKVTLQGLRIGNRCSSCAGNKKKTQQEFVEEVYDIVREEYKVLGEYKNSKTKIEMYHEKCGEEFTVMPSEFLRGARCTFCAKNVRLTQEEFEGRVKEKLGENYIVKGIYKSLREDIRIKHESCGNTYKVKADNVMNGSGCPYCVRDTRKSKEVVIELLRQKFGEEYAITGEYKNMGEEVTFKHNKCNTEFISTVGIMLEISKTSKCPECKVLYKDEEFRKYVYKQVKEEYSVLGKYTNAREHIKFRHNKCGHEYETTPSTFKKGGRCPKCANESKRKTQEQFESEVFAIFGEEYDILGEYTTSLVKVEVRHNKCGNIYEVRPNTILRGSGCPECVPNKKKTTKIFKDEVFNSEGETYTVLGEYVNSTSKLEMKHEVCGNTYEVKPGEFTQGGRCPFCYGTHKKTLEQFKEEVESLEGNEYNVVGDYINNHTKIEMNHLICGLTYRVKPKEFLRGRRCPSCNGSRGERNIRDFLEREGIEYEREKTFEGLVRVAPLRVDFYLPEYNMCIEFDGLQHFEPIDFFGGEESFKNLKENDELKDTYCKDNGINMLRIPYTELGFEEEIITDYIENLRNYLTLI